MTMIFLSYARGDDEPFVRRLYDDLTTQGFDVWFDRVSMPSRQLTFFQEIRDAIASGDRLLLVVGPKALMSDYVTQEWQNALEMGKCVNPVVRLNSQGDDGSTVDGYSLLPEELKLIHAEDFRDDSRYAEHLANLNRQLSDPAPPLGKLVAVPTLPLHYVAQRDRLLELRDALLIELQRPVVVTGAAARVGLQGMGGIGKSVLAAALARDLEVRRAFPDGIFWIGVGQQPNLLELQRFTARELGDETLFNDLHAGKQKLKELLAQRAALLILDDVWHSTDANAFDALGPRCKLLLTTRDAGLVSSMAGIGYQVQLPSEAEAIALLANAVRVPVESLPPLASEIVTECGRLPLALALCASMARGEHGIRWSSILDALRDAQLEEISDDQAINKQHESIWKAIKVSIDTLTPDHRQRWAELSVFAPNRTVPESAVRTLWEYTGALNHMGCQKLLKRLWERSLIYLEPDRTVKSESTRRRVSMHDLLYDYSTRIAGDRKELHRRFADAAWDVYMGRPDEFHGYLRDHLPQHLVAANQPQRLLELIADSKFDYFHKWAEQGMAAEGAACLEFLVNELLKRTGQENFVRSLATQLARLHNRLGHETAAEHWLNVALTGYRAGGEANRTEAVALHELASLALSRGNYRQAATAYRQALRFARRSSTPLVGEIAANLIGLAVVTYLSDLRTARTIRLARLALEWAERAQDCAHTAEACRILADAYKDDMRYPEAEQCLAKGLAIAERDNLSSARLSLLTARAWMFYHQAVLGDRTPNLAEAAFRKLLQHAELVQDWRFEGDAWSGLGQVAVLSNQGHMLEDAINNLSSLGQGRVCPHVEARLRLLEAARLLRSQCFTQAARLYAETAGFSLQKGLRSRQADALIGQGAALFHDGRTGEAERCWQRAEAVLASCPRVRQVIARRCVESCRRTKSEYPFLPL